MESITAFFPAYNDAKTIGVLVEQVNGALRELTAEYEIVVVNDGSSDDTAAVLEALKPSFPRLRVITHPHNRDYGGALRSGFGAATCDLVFYTDGDGQYDPRELRLLAEAMTPEIDVVQGYKRERHDPWHRIVLGQAYRQCVKRLFGLEVRDVDCDFRLMRRSKLSQVELTASSGAICVELVRKLQDEGCRFLEVPVHHFSRQHGSSQFFKFGRLWRMSKDLLRLRLQLSADQLRAS